MLLSVIGNYKDLLKFHFILTLFFSCGLGAFPKPPSSQSHKIPFTSEFSKQFTSYEIESLFQAIVVHSC